MCSTSTVFVNRPLAAVVLAIVLSFASALGQVSQPPAPATPSSPASPSSPGNRTANPPSPSPTPEATPPKAMVPAPGVAKKITPQEMQELQQSMDEILEFASKETGLPVRSKVQLVLRSRNDVRAYIQERLKDDKDTQRLAQAELVMKKLGLLPREFDLRRFILEAYSEQVAGYYDPKIKALCLLDWVPFEEQRSVMAHELTHALQDQKIGFVKWLSAGDAKRKKKGSAQKGIDLDEVMLARDSVAEGQAMIVWWDYQLMPVGRTVEDSGDLIRANSLRMLDSSDSSLLGQAPIYLRRGMIFPYREGVEFIRDVLIKRGKTGAFIGTLDQPPISSRQIMQPETYLADEKIPQLQLPDFPRILGSEWGTQDIGAIGQIDVSVMLQLYAGQDVSDQLTPQWRGGYYYAARKKGMPASQIAVIYVSRWADAATAHRFAATYTHSWKNRYKQAQMADDVPQEGLTSAQTEDGTVSLMERGNLVVAIESFPAAEAEKLREATLHANEKDTKRALFVPMQMHPALDLGAVLRWWPTLRVANTTGE